MNSNLAIFLHKVTGLRSFSTGLLGKPLLVAGIFITFSLSACAPARPPIPAGMIPTAGKLMADDEQYGHEVYGQLSEQYKLSQNDDQIRRVTAIVDRLTAAAKADAEPWHVAVFEDDSFANAAATRGNYIFVWSGIIKAAHSDAELAGVLAHETAHALAGHTAATPADEVKEILGGVLGRAAGEVANVRFPGSMAASIAQTIVTQAYKAIVVNPVDQQKETEADQIGLFLMADAGYDPQAMVDFWEQAARNPAFNTGLPEVLSSHPATESRLATLRVLLPEARLRYRQPKREARPDRPPKTEKARPHASPTLWSINSEWATVYQRPDESSEVVIDLPQDSSVEARHYNSKWLEMRTPVRGYLQYSAVLAAE